MGKPRRLMSYPRPKHQRRAERMCRRLGHVEYPGTPARQYGDAYRTQSDSDWRYCHRCKHGFTPPSLVPAPTTNQRDADG